MKKKHLIKMMMLILLGVIVNVSLPTIADAEAAPISVNPVLPDNQFDKNISYYYLMMEPGAKQEIDLQLFNSSNKEATALVNLTAATTNDNGLIDYSLPDKKPDKSLLYPFPTIASTPAEVVIPPNSDVITKISIEMPVEGYSGMILGGINVKTKKEETKDDGQSGGMKIENEMRYAIGVILIEDEEAVQTDMKLLKVEAGQVMGHNTTKARLQNPTTAVMEDVTVEAKIYKKGSETVLYETKKSGIRMAPNSSFNFGIPIGNERYKAGEYRMKLVGITDPKNPKDGLKQEWEFDVNFTIKRGEADRLNADAVGLPKDYTREYIIAGIAGAVVIILLITFVILRNKKKRKAEAERKARKRKNKNRKASKSSGKKRR